jgi:hypothetical protein
VFGAIFAAHAGTVTAHGSITSLQPVARADVIDGVQTVFVVAAAIAAVAFAVVWWLKEVPLQGPGGPSRNEHQHQKPTGSRSPSG